MGLKIGIPKEVFAGERRAASVPEVVEKLIKLGFAVAVESGAGASANCDDDSYRAAGAEIISSAAGLWAASDIVFKVRGPSSDEVALMHAGQTLISFIWPAQNPELMQELAAKQVTVLAIDALPRTLSRAQKMDALTSQAGVTGQRVWSFLQWADYRCGQSTSGQSIYRWRRCCRFGRDWYGGEFRRNRAGQ